jgi:hypothetical protein
MAKFVLNHIFFKFSRWFVEFLRLFSKTFVHRLEISLLVTFIFLKFGVSTKNFPFIKYQSVEKECKHCYILRNAGRCTFTMAKKKSSTKQENVVHCHWNSQKEWNSKHSFNWQLVIRIFSDFWWARGRPQTGNTKIVGVW